MSRKNFAGAMIIATLISTSAFAREEATYKNDVAVQAFGSFVKSTTQTESNRALQTAVASLGALASSLTGITASSSTRRKHDPSI